MIKTWYNIIFLICKYSWKYIYFLITRIMIYTTGNSTTLRIDNCTNKGEIKRNSYIHNSLFTKVN